MNSVLHVITTIEMGGAEKQLLILAREQRINGRPVSVVFLKGNPELKDSFENIGVQVFDDISNKNPLTQIFKLRKILNKIPNLTIHAHLPRAELISAIVRKKNTLVISRHNAEAFFPSHPGILSRVLSRFVSRRSTLVIAISAAVKNFLIESNEIDKSKKIQVIYYGFDSIFREIESTSGNLHDNFKIGTISRLVPQKDIGTLLSAFKKVIEKYPSLKLSIVGDGYLKDSLQHESKKLGISSSVDWLGRTEDIGGYLKSIDLFVLTSRYEGFGLVLLEAMCSEVPILAPNNSAIPEVLGNEYPGLFETGNSAELSTKIEDALDEVFRKLLLSRAEARLKIFDPVIMLENMDEAYSEMEKK
jgi:glycosyltransferase involved in cell wall biosynthesis